MDTFDFLSSINIDLITQYARTGGPIMGIMLPVIEAFFPALPLVVFVTINVGVFGFAFGYLYSWIGNCLGSFLVFLLLKKVGGNRIEKKLEGSKYKKTLGKIKENNFSVLFFLYCFPFTPSFLISGASALANMSTRDFLLALIPSKFVMLLSLVFIGVNVNSFFDNPLKSVIYIVLICLFNILCKRIVGKVELSIIKRKKY